MGDKKNMPLMDDFTSTEGASSKLFSSPSFGGKNLAGGIKHDIRVRILDQPCCVVRCDCIDDLYPHANHCSAAEPRSAKHIPLGYVSAAARLHLSVICLLYFKKPTWIKQEAQVCRTFWESSKTTQHSKDLLPGTCSAEANTCFLVFLFPL